MRWPWTREKHAEHLSRAEKRRIDELIDAGQGDTAIARQVGRSRTTIWRYRDILLEQRARTAVEQRDAQFQQLLTDKFIELVEKADLRASLTGLAVLSKDVRRAILVHITDDLDVTAKELAAFDRWLIQWHERPKQQVDDAATPPEPPPAPAA